MRARLRAAAARVVRAGGVGGLAVRAGATPGAAAAALRQEGLADAYTYLLGQAHRALNAAFEEAEALEMK